MLELTKDPPNISEYALVKYKDSDSPVISGEIFSPLRRYIEQLAMLGAVIYWCFPEYLLLQKSDFQPPGCSSMEVPAPILPFGRTLTTINKGLYFMHPCATFSLITSF